MPGQANPLAPGDLPENRHNGGMEAIAGRLRQQPVIVHGSGEQVFARNRLHMQWSAEFLGDFRCIFRLSILGPEALYIECIERQTAGGRQGLMGIRSNCGRIKAAAHRYGHWTRAQPIRYRLPEPLPEMFHIVGLPPVSKLPIQR